MKYKGKLYKKCWGVCGSSCDLLVKKSERNPDCASYKESCSLVGKVWKLKKWQPLDKDNLPDNFSQENYDLRGCSEANGKIWTMVPEWESYYIIHIAKVSDIEYQYKPKKKKPPEKNLCDTCIQTLPDCTFNRRLSEGQAILSPEGIKLRDGGSITLTCDGYSEKKPTPKPVMMKYTGIDAGKYQCQCGHIEYVDCAE